MDENLLVLAGPGSGKTRLLTHAAAYRLRLTPTERWRVCCLTFTVEAARQLRSRLQSPELGAVPARRVWVSNFHQFAQMLLGSYGHLLGWPRTAGIITPTEAKSLLAEIVGESGMGNVNVSDVLNAISGPVALPRDGLGHRVRGIPQRYDPPRTALDRSYTIHTQFLQAIAMIEGCEGSTKSS